MQLQQPTERTLVQVTEALVTMRRPGHTDVIVASVKLDGIGPNSAYEWRISGGTGVESRWIGDPIARQYGVHRQLVVD